MRLAIGGPTRDYVAASFAVDVARLYAYTQKRGPWSDVTIGFVQSTYIHVGREWFLEASIKQGATHVLWLDTDMTFPQETAILLAGHDVAIVGCNYVTRTGGDVFTAQRVDGSRVATSVVSAGLESVDAMGFGVVLMRTDLVASLPRPWFRHGINRHGGDVGEDIMFCRALQEHAGVEILIDHDLSKEVGHIGQHTYRTIARETADA
jgi:hypothetical protein